MTVTTLSRLWGEILILAGLQLVLTAILVTGGTEQCGEKRVCGYGARCYNKVTGCVCLSDGDKLMKQEGNPNAVFYCLGEGVKQCGDQLCGYGAECDTAKTGCGCSRDNVVRTQLEGTFPSLWYCVEKCSSESRNCPENTTCTDRTGDNRYRCYCSAGATRSSTGQCLGNITTVAVESTVHDTTESFSPTEYSFAIASKPITEITRKTQSSSGCPDNTTCTNGSGDNHYPCLCSAETRLLSTGQCLFTTLGSGVIPKEEDPSIQCNNKEDDSPTLTIGHAAGISAGVLLAVVIMVLLIRRHRCLKARENTHSSANTLSTEFNHSYGNALSLSLSGESRPGSPSIPTGDRPSVDVPDNNSPNTYVNVSASSQSPDNNDTSGLYESANTPDTSETRLYTTVGQT